MLYFLAVFGMMVMFVGRLEAAQDTSHGILLNAVFLMEVVHGKAFEEVRLDGSHDVEWRLELWRKRMTLLVVIALIVTFLLVSVVVARSGGIFIAGLA